MVFLNYYKNKEKTYILDIIMELGRCDLVKVFQDNKKKDSLGCMKRKAFFPLFRDCFLVLSFIHN